MVRKPAMWVAVLACMAAEPVFGHAYLDHAEPKVGAEVAATPAAVKITFTSEVQAKESDVQVFDAADKEIDAKDCHWDARDKAVLIVSLPATLGNGVYKVKWRVTSLKDGHKTEGDYTFTVKPKP